MKVLFLDLDDVLVLDKCRFLVKEANPFYDNFFYQYEFDPFGRDFLNGLFKLNEDLYCVLHSTWRKDCEKDWLLQHFKHQKAEFRWHESFCTDPRLSRWDSISWWLSEHKEVSRSDYAVLDDEKPPQDFKTRTVRVNGQTGLDFKDCERLVNLLHLKSGYKQTKKMVGGDYLLVGQ